MIIGVKCMYVFGAFAPRKLGLAIVICAVRCMSELKVAVLTDQDTLQ